MPIAQHETEVTSHSGQPELPEKVIPLHDRTGPKFRTSGSTVIKSGTTPDTRIGDQRDSASEAKETPWKLTHPPFHP